MVVYQWNIFWVQLDPIKGSEQSGIRPVIVISAEEVNQVLPVLTVLPLTSLKENRKVYQIETFLPAIETGLTKDSIAMAHQIRAIYKKRLLEKCGSVKSDDLKEKIRLSLKKYLDI